MSSLPGITRQDEEKRLQHTLEIAQRKVDANRQSVQALAEELHAMQEEFDENDKEAQALWHNADARFKFVNQDLRRAEQARKKPYFGRIDFRDKKTEKKTRSAISAEVSLRITRQNRRSSTGEHPLPAYITMPLWGMSLIP